MVAIEEEPDMTRVIKSYTSLSKIQCALRCKRHEDCTDIAVTDGKVGVCYLKSASEKKNKVENRGNKKETDDSKKATTTFSKLDTKELDAMIKDKTANSKTNTTSKPAVTAATTRSTKTATGGEIPKTRGTIQ